MPTTGLETPRCSIFTISRGRAVSEDEVATMSRYSWRRLVQDLEDVHPGGGLEDAAEDDDDEHDAGGVKDGDEHGQGYRGGPAGGADDAGDGAERANRGKPHDAGEDLEDRVVAGR